MVVNHEGRAFQVGIVSYGFGCARKNMPAMYTRVDAFAEWIHARITEMPNNSRFQLKGGVLQEASRKCK